MLLAPDARPRTKARAPVVLVVQLQVVEALAFRCEEVHYVLVFVDWQCQTSSSNPTAPVRRCCWQHWTLKPACVPGSGTQERSFHLQGGLSADQAFCSHCKLQQDLDCLVSPTRSQHCPCLPQQHFCERCRRRRRGVALAKARTSSTLATELASPPSADCRPCHT